MSDTRVGPRTRTARQPAPTGAVPGQAGHRRPGRPARADGRRPAGRRATCWSRACPAWPRRWRSRRFADALGVEFQRIQFTPDLVPADIVGTRIYNQKHRRVRGLARPDLRQPGPGRRDQPGAGQGAERPARGDAGAAGHDRRRDLPAARPVPGHGHAEPDRAGGHLPAARGAGRPVHAEGARRLPERRPRSSSSSTARCVPPNDPRDARPSAPDRPAGTAREVFVDPPSSTTPSAW